jgi:hypothetical protein
MDSEPDLGLLKNLKLTPIKFHPRFVGIISGARILIGGKQIPYRNLR